MPSKKKIQELHATRETEAKAQTNAVVIAQSESRLNQQERSTFAGFLKEDYFTKTDFGKLEEFYEKSWDRLSEHGKDEMSKRIWGGIRHGKYSFGDLPPKVREHEMERAYGAVTKQHGQSAEVSAIPEKDRHDFIRAFEEGKKDEAAKILERDSFKKHLFERPESAARSHTNENLNREAEKPALAASSANAQPNKEPEKAAHGGSNAIKDLAGFSLEGVKLAESKVQGTSADIPNARIPTPSSSRSTPGG
ncbi:MAG: hypothetical protein WDN28_29440 [Chthoniobacter sp.]